MSKLKITEAQIDSFNETYNQLYRFDDGLNIICGPNEAGKSTLMEFIKNIFIKKSSSAKGYIKCENNGEKYNLVAGDTKSMKPNEKYISGINSHEYKTGFIITLDDIMLSDKKDADALINTIKDSSGEALNTIQQKYDSFIHKKSEFPLTPSNGVGVDFNRQFEVLNSTNNDIIKIQNAEEEYNRILDSVETLDNELTELNKRLEGYQKLLLKNGCINEKAQININQKLILKKDEFDKIRQELGGLNSVKSKESELKDMLSATQIEVSAKLKELSSLTQVSGDEDYLIQKEDLKTGRELLTKENGQELEKNKTETNLSLLKQNIDEKDFELQNLKNKLEELGIDDIKEYKTNFSVLSDLSSKYSDLKEKSINSDVQNDVLIKTANYNSVFALVFGAIFCACLGVMILYWNTDIKLFLAPIVLASLVGVNISIMQKFRKISDNVFYKELDKTADSILKITKKYGFTIDKDDSFISKVKSFTAEMNEKIKDYEMTEPQILNYRLSLQKLRDEYKNKEQELGKIIKTAEEINKDKKEFLTRLKLVNIGNLEDVYNLSAEIKSLKAKEKELETNLKNIDDKTESFVEDVNRFIDECEPEGIMKLNKYDKFDEIIDKIGDVLFQNIKNNTTLTDLEQKIAEYEKDLESYNLDITDISAEEADNLKTLISAKTNEKGMLLQKKSDLEQVSELANLKSKKNMELARIRSGLTTLLEKEVVLELIKGAKDEFNSIQPNLISAKEYLKHITNNKYDEIDFEEKVISGENSGDKEWAKLSRGTKEQLYLALRLGYAYNYSKDLDGNPNGQPDLPVIIDDAFVNFDKSRTTAILKCLSEFSSNSQVLYFTCHKDMIGDILKKEKIKHNLIEI